MSETETIEAKKREGRGGQFNKRLRLSGKTPAVLYGKGEGSVPLTIPTDSINLAIRHGAHLIKLTGDIDDNVLLKEIQWDAFGSQILHVDFTRVDMSQSVTVALPIELRGVAPGTKSGGVVELQARQLDLECPVASIPEKFELSINELQLDGTITAAELELPAGAKLLVPLDTVLVTCVEPEAKPEEDELAGEASGAEPEVIGAKDNEEGD